MAAPYSLSLVLPESCMLSPLQGLRYRMGEKKKKRKEQMKHTKTELNNNKKIQCGLSRIPNFGRSSILQGKVIAFILGQV